MSNDIELNGYVTFCGDVFKVKQIGDTILIDRGRGRVEVSTEEIKPISLTQDILDKNRHLKLL